MLQANKQEEHGRQQGLDEGVLGVAMAWLMMWLGVGQLDQALFNCKYIRLPTQLLPLYRNKPPASASAHRHTHAPTLHLAHDVVQVLLELLLLCDLHLQPRILLGLEAVLWVDATLVQDAVKHREVGACVERSTHRTERQAHSAAC